MNKISGNSLLAVILAAITFSIFYPFASIGVDFHHDGIILKPALDVSSGQVLFRDSFSQYGALTTWMHAICLRIYPSLLSLRIFTVITYSLGVFFFVSCWLQLAPRGIAVTGWLIFIISAPFYDKRWLLLPWSSSLFLMFQAAVLTAVFKCIDNRNSIKWAILLGVFCAMGFWARPLLTGVGLSCALCLIWLILSFGRSKLEGITSRQWSLAGISFIAINLCITLYLILSNSFAPWIEQNWLWPFRGYTGGNLHNTTVFDRVIREVRINEGANVCMYYIAIYTLVIIYCRKCKSASNFIKLAYIASAISILCFAIYKADNLSCLKFGNGWSANNGGLFSFIIIVIIFCGIHEIWHFSNHGWKIKHHKKVLALLIISGASLAQFYPTFSMPQQWWSLTPAFGLFAYFIYIMCGRKNVISITLILLIFTPSLIERVKVGIDKLYQPLTTLSSPTILAGMRVSPSMEILIRSLDNAMNSLPPDDRIKPVALIGEDAMYCVFSKDLSNITQYYISFTNLIPPDVEKDRNRTISKKRPIVIFCSSQRPLDLKSINDFCKKYDYRKILDVKEKPVEWWWGGQQDNSIIENPVSGGLNAEILCPN
jgi:hypothetical protein